LQHAASGLVAAATAICFGRSRHTVPASVLMARTASFLVIYAYGPPARRDPL